MGTTRQAFLSFNVKIFSFVRDAKQWGKREILSLGLQDVNKTITAEKLIASPFYCFLILCLKLKEKIVRGVAQ